MTGIAVAPGVLRLPPKGAKLKVGFGLRYAGNAALRVETPLGTIVRTVTKRGLPAGRQTLVWDGRVGTKQKPLVHSGRYVARLIVTNQYGKAELSKPFTVRRVVGPKPKPKRK